jgi:murein DD-endopeptidase MepM/ murein hydrolase activator NlpD
VKIDLPNSVRRVLVGTLLLFWCLLNPAILSAAAQGDMSSGDEVQLFRRSNSPDSRELLPPYRAPSPFEGLEGLRYVALKSKAGDTLGSLFSQFGLSFGERQEWLRSIQKHFPAKSLRPGKEMHFYLSQIPSSLTGLTGKEHLQAFEIELDQDWKLTWEKGPKGIQFQKREQFYEVELKSAVSTVEGSSLDGGLQPRLHPALLSQLADIFNWEVDFNKDIHRGDSVKLLYEERSRKGKQQNPSFRILAAELINSGQKFFVIYFEKEKGKGNYYDLGGRSLARAFLRFPLEFSSISSQFAHSRFNPILKMALPHHGVDFSAERGTPVRAVGDGKITYAGWKQGGYGRIVDIQHDSTYSTRYAHLLGLARGLKDGMMVRKGQIIGYVGSSGRTTGNHLHFEIYKDQQYVDPLNFEIPPEDTIEPYLRRIFENAKYLFLAELAATPAS